MLTAPIQVNDLDGHGSIDATSVIGSLGRSRKCSLFTRLACVVAFVLSDKSIDYISCTMNSDTALHGQFLHNYTVSFDSIDSTSTCADSNGENPYIPNPTYPTSVQKYDRFIRHREDTYLWMLKVSTCWWVDW